MSGLSKYRNKSRANLVPVTLVSEEVSKPGLSAGNSSPPLMFELLSVVSLVVRRGRFLEVKEEESSSSSEVLSLADFMFFCIFHTKTKSKKR